MCFLKKAMCGMKFSKQKTDYLKSGPSQLTFCFCGFSWDGHTTDKWALRSAWSGALWVLSDVYIINVQGFSPGDEVCVWLGLLRRFISPCWSFGEIIVKFPLCCSQTAVNDGLNSYFMLTTGKIQVSNGMYLPDKILKQYHGEKYLLS